MCRRRDGGPFMRTSIALVVSMTLSLAGQPAHGADRRIWSPALCAKRDLYVYLPPGYDRAKKYPLLIFLHGAGQDEQLFLKNLAKEFDQTIAAGKFPPAVVAAPDGSMLGRPSF